MALRHGTILTVLTTLKHTIHTGGAALRRGATPLYHGLGRSDPRLGYSEYSEYREYNKSAAAALRSSRPSNCAVPRCAALCRAAPRCAALYRAVPRGAALRCAARHFAALCRAMPYPALYYPRYAYCTHRT